MGEGDPPWVGAGIERRIPRSADFVFDRLTDLASLPAWADDVTEVIELPAALEPGARWRSVRPGRSRREVQSVVLSVDPVARRFAYHRSAHLRSESYSEWRWECVADGPDECRVQVGWVLRPAAGGPFVLATSLRHRRLHRAMTDALGRLESLCTSTALRVTRIDGAAADTAPLPA